MQKITLLLIGFLLAASSSFAQSNEANRFTLLQKDGATVRLDKTTGAISYCRTVNGGMTCSMAADEREAWSAEMEVMANRIDLLQKRLSALEALVEGKTPEQTDKKPKEEIQTSKAPDKKTEDRKFDKAMDQAETFMRRMMGVLKDMRKDFSTQE